MSETPTKFILERPKNSLICLYLSNWLLPFDIFYVFKLLLTNLMCVSSIIITHYWITRLILILAGHLHWRNRVLSHLKWILDRSWGAIRGLLDCRFLSINLTWLDSRCVQERDAWILLVCVVCNILVTLWGQIESFSFCESHSHFIRCSHSKSIVIIILLSFW